MRVLITGQSGVSHDTVRHNLEEQIIDSTGYRERDILSKDIGNVIKNDIGQDWWAFLESGNQEWQKDICNEAIEIVMAQIEDEAPEVVLLSTHLCMFRKSRYFTPIDWKRFIKYSPDNVITLIDDIYTVQSRINRREDQRYGADTYLRLRELITWRSIEILMTDRMVDFINSHKSKSLENYVVSVKHPKSMLYDLLFTPEKPVVYGGTSLSTPRSSDAGIAEVNSYRNKLSDSFVVFDPVTIDEAILNFKFFERDSGRLKTKFQETDELSLSVEDRWPLSFGENEPLCDDEGEYPITLDVDEVREVSVSISGQRMSDIENQIRNRDFRLINQSEIMIGYRPFFRGSKSTGLLAELRFAHHSIHMPIYIVHNDETDGNLGGHPFDIKARKCESTDEMIDNIRQKYETSI